MARYNVEILRVLRETAFSIQASPDYQWGHMGSCNCGFLAQQITGLNKREIHNSAMERYGDWNEQLHDYCPSSGLLIDDIISAMLDFGFDADDLKHLEKLSDPEVLRRLPGKSLVRNRKEDVITYLLTWADLVEEKLAIAPHENDIISSEVIEDLRVLVTA